MSLRPATSQRSVSGADCLDVGLAHLPPARHGDTVGEVARQPRHALTGLGEEVEDADLGEHVVVPGRLGADPAGEPAHTVGECGGTGVGESPGDLVPGREAGDARIGESAPEPVFEPAIELDQSPDELLDALVACPFCGVGRPARRAPATVRRRRQRSVGSASAGAPTAAACCSAARRCRPSSQPATFGGSATVATWPRTHSTRRATTCLHGWTLLGHVHRSPTSTWSTATSYGSEPDPW